MAEPTLDQRTPAIRLKFEADDTRNYNWNKLDDTIGRAFTAGSPLQLPGGPPPVGVAPTTLPQVWVDPVTHALSNVSNGPLLDALNLVLADGHVYRMTVAGDIAKVSGQASIIALIGGVLIAPGYAVGGGTGAQQETFLIEFTVRIEGTQMRIAGVTRSAVGVGTLLPATTSIVSESLAKAGSGNGIYVQATWDNVNAGNTAHTTIGMIECI